ncbi:MAG: hypothetical protein WAV11_00325 [Minisyncoccia bacterium]
MKKILKNKHGFAILFAILTSSLLLMVGLSIFNISIKELTITSFNTESKKAMYAAQSGMECFIYGTFNAKKIFNFKTGTFLEDVPDVNCGSNTVFSTFGKDLPFISFSFTLTDDESSSCAIVKITDDGEEINTVTGSTTYKIIADSYGYNANDCSNIDYLENNTRLVEKSFQANLAVPQDTN